ncbi:hypothetical protein TCAL_11788 [Tigriopus californicus]|uniref:CRAL-TRIO domain-containing protein n=1 Tax=Tigriopus californicus TaxID=6832 RepID=A0A553NP98_TIGCA|nr:alpha-tocopherol transfer protein-like [Tigriopus californicus]TRY67243.1 hypothetical protein TCAL_11788 [Tigriopus californicus]
MELSIEHDPNFGSMNEEELSANWKQAAKSNVNDVVKERQAKIKVFRDLLAQHHIQLRPGDDHQLLGILRSANCDVKKALDVAKEFLEYKIHCTNVLPSTVREMITDNLKRFMVLPHRDKHGRRIIVYKMWDADKYPYKTIMEMFYVLCMMLSREVKTQIAGISLVGDMAGMTRKHVPSTWSDIQTWATFMKGGVPVWFHSIHILNGPWLFEFLYSFAKPLLNDKTKGNVVLHKRADGFKTLHAEIDPQILPEEFGGTAGKLDNSLCLSAALKLDDYFKDLQNSTID